MPTDVLMPQMGESITEGTLTKWLKKPGDTVARDEPLFEISTDKVDAEIPSPVAGTLGEIKVNEGATVGVNTIVCTVSEGAASAAAQVSPASAPARPETAAQSTKIEDTVTPSAEATAIRDAAINGNGAATLPPASSTAGPATEVLMPQMGESITEGTLTKWLKKIGDTVQRDEPIFEISTDKVDAEIPSPIAGTLTEIKVQEGSTVTINTVVAVIGGAGASSSAPKTVAPGAATPSAGYADVTPVSSSIPAASAAQGEPTRSSPLVRKIAADNKIDLSGVAGTGASGRITKQDILGHMESGSSATPAAASQSTSVQPAAQFQNQTTAASQPAPDAATHATYAQAQSAAATTAPAKAAAAPTPQPGELVPMSKMRAIIARRMVESKQTSAHVHTVFKVDMTRIARLREKEKTKYEQRNGVKLTYMPFITRATVQALRKHAIVNAATEGEAIRYNKHINIGIAVALEWGLIVPVLKQTEEKSFLGIARGIVDLADRARSKKLAPDDVAGGTFTLTNSGIFGEQFGTPIIAQPQSAILGIGGLNKEPMVLTDKDGNDSIAVRYIQRFTLGFDHRIIDGSDAGKFMTDFKNYLENWTEDLG
ncbi:MAG: 2-oxo acid dehydrogenase subunit E2 [Janthinobacterium lividum]